MLYLSDLKTSVYLSFTVAHGDKKAVFPLCGVTCGFQVNHEQAGCIFS